MTTKNKPEPNFSMNDLRQELGLCQQPIEIEGVFTILEMAGAHVSQKTAANKARQALSTGSITKHTVIRNKMPRAAYRTVDPPHTLENLRLVTGILVEETPGALTTVEWAEVFGGSSETMRRKIGKAKREGKVKQVPARRKQSTGQGSYYPVDAYVFIGLSDEQLEMLDKLARDFQSD